LRGVSLWRHQLKNLEADNAEAAVTKLENENSVRAKRNVSDCTICKIEMKNGDRIEYYKTEKLNFTDASEECSKSNMTLPVPQDKEENDFFTSLGGTFLPLGVNNECPNKPLYNTVTNE